MPRYFFNVYPDSAELDREGTEIADSYEAQAEAVRMAGEIMRDLGRRFWTGEEWRLDVIDAEGNRIFVVRFSAREVADGEL
ncbi:hypothetical protein L0F51_08250 [Afifella sp. H1R]|uniref:DUF6894 family protein n=1 Tax=Afifella sp. H1R TaxID=2908841 RepID=UPI001F3C2A66|nr:hypothetical protein [Afifella sp. H1R]MCF1503750.1 hypothetical protein [Afifella sp. H1R]